MPSKHLGVALNVLSDMVKNPLFDGKELEKERQVIFEEIKMRKDSPRVYVFDKIQSYLYGGTLGISLIGTYDTMNSIARKQLFEKFKETYQPSNLILGIVGDADFEGIVKFAEKTFGKIQNGKSDKGKLAEPKIVVKNESKFEKRKGIDQANLIFAHHVPLAGDKKSYAAMVLITLMAGGMSSRLFTEIREKRNLAYAVKGDCDINKSFAHNLIYVGTTAGNVEKIRKIILDEFKKVARGLTERELKQIKEQLIGNYNISMEDSQIQLINLLLCEMNGDANEFYDFVKNISNVKLKDVKDLAKIKNYSFFALVPE
jgi:predicted Zn-dependent peptidase